MYTKSYKMVIIAETTLEIKLLNNSRNIVYKQKMVTVAENTLVIDNKLLLTNQIVVGLQDLYQKYVMSLEFDMY